MIKIFDAFCSNGSTWNDKEYFLKNVIKNDIRGGVIKIINQEINIITDTQIDMFDNKDLNIGIVDLIYADPPFLIYANENSIMGKKYTSLGYDFIEKLDNMFNKCSKASKLMLLKFSDNDIDINRVYELAGKYYYIGVENYRRTKSKTNMTFFTLLISKSNF